MGGGSGVSGMDLHQIVTTALEAIDLLVCHALCQTGEFFVLAKEVFAVEAPVFGCEGLHLTVHDLSKGTCQGAGCIPRKQAIPVAAPDQLDDVPTRTCEELFQFVDDSAIAAYRAIKTLQIAVDYPDQVVKLFTCGKCQCAHALGLIHLAVAKNTPDFSDTAIDQLAIREVTHEPRMVNRAYGADAH